jgi:hypothetical protein
MSASLKVPALNEPLLSDSDTIYADYNYVADGKPVTSGLARHHRSRIQNAPRRQGNSPLRPYWPVDAGGVRLMTLRYLLQDLCAALSAGAFVTAVAIWASYLTH